MIVLLVTKLLYIHFEMSGFDFATLINYRYQNHDDQHLMSTIIPTLIPSAYKNFVFEE